MEQAVEFGTQKYGDGFYLRVKPHKDEAPATSWHPRTDTARRRTPRHTSVDDTGTRIFRLPRASGLSDRRGPEAPPTVGRSTISLRFPVWKHGRPTRKTP